MTPEQRSRCMSRVKSRDTKPEILVRSMLHRMGFRFRVCFKGLPGKPDIVFPGRKKVILVHGCFWHMHDCVPPARRLPKSNVEFWKIKLEGNRRRDESQHAALCAIGWRVHIVWTCQLTDLASASDAIVEFLSS